jgi:excisionase family DNA binding protein
MGGKMDIQNTTYGSLPDRDFLTIPEIAAFLRISEKTCYAWAHDGNLPSVKLGGRVRVPRKEFLVWLEARKRKSA